MGLYDLRCEMIRNKTNMFSLQNILNTRVPSSRLVQVGGVHGRGGARAGDEAEPRVPAVGQPRPAQVSATWDACC